jgi:hypothetical protein
MTTTNFTYQGKTPMGHCCYCKRPIKSGANVSVDKVESKAGIVFRHRHTDCESAMPTDVKTAPQDLMDALASEAETMTTKEN